jgi:anti-sigma factor RsiW
VTCAPDRVTGYVDDALDATTRAELESHLATCATCREQVAFERELRAGLRALPLPELRPGFEPAVRRRLAAERRVRRSWLLPVAAALAILALWARGAAPFVAWQVARDHNHCFGKERLPAKVWSNDPVEVIRWFEAQGTRLPPIPTGVGELGLVGARYCPLVDRVAAHLYYAGEERHLSVFVLSGPARFRDSWATESRGNEVRFLRSAGMTVALVSAKHEDVEAFRAAFATTVASIDPFP